MTDLASGVFLERILESA